MSLRVDEARTISVNIDEPLPPSFFYGAVLTMHGVRSTGEWVSAVQEQLTLNHLIQLPVNAGFLPLRSVVDPFALARGVTLFRAQYEHALPRYNRVAAIAHSFGTRIFERWLRETPTARVDAAILFGSILPCGTDWLGPLEDGRLGRLMNESTPSDWSVWAGAGLFSWTGRTGRGGLDGFACKHERLKQFEYEKTGHGKHVTPSHVRQRWIPFLKDQPE